MRVFKLPDGSRLIKYVYVLADTPLAGIVGID